MNNISVKIATGQ